MKLIIGLGNPGKEYDKTRHNIGFMCIDKLASYYDIPINKKKFDGLYNEFIHNEEKVILLKPQSYINLSGQVIKKYIDYFKIPISDILVICDDMDLSIGNYKLKYKGGSAGHNGLKNIESALQTNEYKRLKIGISKNKMIDAKDYVLGKLTIDDMQQIESIIAKVPNIISDFITISFDKVMNKYNIQDTD